MYKPSPKQLAFHEDQHPVKVLLSGVGFGKTTAAIYEALWNAMYKHPGKIGMLLAPSYKLLQQGLLQAWKNIVPQDYYTINGQAQQISLINGSTIYCRSSHDPDSLRASNLAWCVFDEASAESDKQVYYELINRLRDPAPNQKTQLIITTTPNGSNWIPKTFGFGPHSTGFKGTQDYWYNDFSSVRRATTFDNPRYPIDSDYVKNLMLRPDASEEWVNQNVYALFTSKTGLVFPQFKPKHIVSAIPKNIIKYYAGHDFGFGISAMIIVGETTDKKLVVVHEEYHKNLTSDESGWFPLINQLKQQYKISWIVCDNANADRIAAMRRHFNHSPIIYESSKNTHQSIRRVQKLLQEDRLFVHESCKNYIEEIQNWSWKVDKRTGVSFDTPEDGGDHILDSQNYLVNQIPDSFWFK